MFVEGVFNGFYLFLYLLTDGIRESNKGRWRALLSWKERWMITLYQQSPPVPPGPHPTFRERKSKKEWIENWRMVGFWKEQRIGACIWAWKRPSWPTAYDDVKEICQPGNPIASNFSLPSPSTPTSTSGLNYNSKVPLGCPCQYQRYRIVLAQTGPTWRPICQNVCLGVKQLEISSISNL